MQLGRALATRPETPTGTWTEMTIEDAIALVKEKDRRTIRCPCPDCEAQTLLVKEIERLRNDLKRYAMQSHKL